ncbi:reverse transcriptase domain-containing protein [Tanacetum coccineum]
MVTPVEKKGSNKFCDFHNDKGHSTDECMQLKKQIEELPWQRTTKQKLTQSFVYGSEITFPPLANSDGTEDPLVIEAKIGGHMIHRMYIDGGSSTKILYEHCFNQLRPEIKSQMVPTKTSLTGFSGETIWPLGQLRLLVTIGDADHCTKAWMDFMIVRSISPYNGIIGRPGIREIQSVPSTAHEMLKFPADEGIVTIRSTILIPAECDTVITSPKEIPKEAGVRHENLKVAIHPNFPDQEVVIGGTLSLEGRTELCTLLKKKLDIFAWQPSDMTGVPLSIAEHRLNIRGGYLPVRKKKRGQAPERSKAIQAKDCYPLPEINWKIESLCGYPFKCFLDAYKGYHQIQMAESDEEKTTFHTSQGVYCYTKMPFGLKNAGATYQRLVDKAFDSQLPLLVVPKPKEELIIYLSASYGAVSAVLMNERDTVQTPVYFISCALQGPELNYTLMEKLVLSLVFAAKRLRKAVTKIERHARRTQYHIPSKNVGERTDTGGLPHGSGAGLILTSPEGTEFTYALRFQFTASNNEAEYEALIAGLQIAAQMGVQKVKSLVSGFANFSIRQVPRSRNKKADALSKIASTNFAHLSKQVLVEVLKEISIQGKEVTTVVEEDGPTWMTPIMKYLQDGTLPGDRKEASKLPIKARQYELMEGILYRRSFLKP